MFEQQQKINHFFFCISTIHFMRRPFLYDFYSLHFNGVSFDQKKAKHVSYMTLLLLADSYITYRQDILYVVRAIFGQQNEKRKENKRELERHIVDVFISEPVHSFIHSFVTSLLFISAIILNNLVKLLICMCDNPNFLIHSIVKKKDQIRWEINEEMNILQCWILLLCMDTDNVRVRVGVWVRNIVGRHGKLKVFSALQRLTNTFVWVDFVGTQRTLCDLLGIDRMCAYAYRICRH